MKLRPASNAVDHGILKLTRNSFFFLLDIEIFYFSNKDIEIFYFFNKDCFVEKRETANGKFFTRNNQVKSSRNSMSKVARTNS